MPGKVYGLWKWRPWTRAEDRRVRAGGTARSIAADLGRTMGAVLERRRVLGIALTTATDPARDRAIAKLHAAGRCDAGIARAIGVSPTTVRTCRGRLGLPPNRKGDQL